MSKANESAFPCPMGGDWPECDRGITTREYFAAMAMQGILLSDSRCQSSFGASEAASFFEIHAGVGNNQSQAVAWRACHMADALIAELNKPKEPQ